MSYTSVFRPTGHAAEEAAPGTSVVRVRTAYGPGRRALAMPGAPQEVLTWIDPPELDEVRSEVWHRVDLVLVSCHWGVSISDSPVDDQRQLGRAAIEAELMVGHHPRVIQPIEFHTGRPIFCSLGNFAFDWPKMRDGHQDGLVLRLEIGRGGVRRIRLVPVRRDVDNQIGPLEPASAEGERILARLRDLSGEAIALAVSGDDIDLRDHAGTASCQATDT